MVRAKPKPVEMQPEDELCECGCCEGDNCDCSPCGSYGCAAHFCAKCAPLVLVFGVILLVAGLGLYTASWFNTNTILGAFLVLAGVMAISGMNRM